MQEFVSGGITPAPKGRRFASGLIDLVIIPIILGVILGFALLSVPGGIRNLMLILVNIGWLVFRDAVYSPGRTMVGLKLVSLTGEKISIAQAFIRNILLIIPIVLIIGYIVEIIALLAKGHRVADLWAKTQVVQA